MIIFTDFEGQRQHTIFIYVTDDNVLNPVFYKLPKDQVYSILYVAIL